MDLSNYTEGERLAIKFALENRAILHSFLFLTSKSNPALKEQLSNLLNVGAEGDAFMAEVRDGARELIENMLP